MQGFAWKERTHGFLSSSGGTGNPEKSQLCVAWGRAQDRRRPLTGVKQKTNVVDLGEERPYSRVLRGGGHYGDRETFPPWYLQAPSEGLEEEA